MENGKISSRQLFRYFTLILLGPLTLLVPQELAGAAGIGGLIILAVGMAGAKIYLAWILQSIRTGKQIPASRRYAGVNQTYTVILILLGLLTSVIALYYFAELMAEMLAKEVAYIVVLGCILALSGYQLYMHKGGQNESFYEQQGRIFELLYPAIMVGILLPLALSVKDIQTVNLARFAVPDGEKLGEGAIYVLLCQNAMAYLPGLLAQSQASLRENEIQIHRAWRVSMGLLFILVVILIGSFGGPALGQMDHPVIVLMSNIQFRGGFLKRLDALATGIWFFLLYAQLNLNLSFATRGIYAVTSKTADFARENEADKNRSGLIILSVLFIVGGIVLGMREMNSIRYIIRIIYLTSGIGAMLLIPVLTMYGCGAVELENRSFPMAALVCFEEERELDPVGVGIQLPKLKVEPDASGMAEPSAISIYYAKNFEEALNQCVQSQNKKLDYNHLKVIVMNEDYYQNETRRNEMLDYMRAQTIFPRNAYVCMTKDADALMQAAGATTENLGEYLEQLLEKYEREHRQKLPTLGQLCDEEINQYGQLELPVLYVNAAISQQEDEMNNLSISVNTPL